MPRRAARWGASPVMSASLYMTLPARGGTRPRMLLRTVVLPAPLRPRREDFAALDVERHPLQHVDEAVVGVNALQAEDHRRTPRYARCTSRFSRTSSGVPSAISSPKAITEIRSEIDITIRILCSMRRIV